MPSTATAPERFGFQAVAIKASASWTCETALTLKEFCWFKKPTTVSMITLGRVCAQTEHAKAVARS